MCVNSIQWVNKHGIHFAQLVLVNLNLSFAPICRLTAVSVTPHQQDTTQGDLLLKYLQKKTTGGSVEHKLYVNLFSQKVIDNKKQLDAKNNILKTGKRLTVRLRLDPANPVDPSAICPDLILRFLYNSTN